MTGTTDAEGYSTAYTYDPAGDRTSETTPIGDKIEWEYNSAHEVIGETSPMGEKTTIERDIHGNVLKASRPAPGKETQTTKYSYDGQGDLEAVETPGKHTWHYEYDSYGDRTAETDPEGNKRTWEYDKDSSETATFSPRGHAKGAKESSFKTTILRDERERPIKVTDPLGHVTKFSYDGAGNLEKLTDPAEGTTTYTYDADNERTKTSEPDGSVSETGYDAEGEPKSQTNGDKQTTEYVHNALEQVTEEVNPRGRKTVKHYNATGLLASVTDPSERTTSYSYSPAEQLAEVSYSDGKTHSSTYAYNEEGELTSITDGSGTSTYSYDQLGRMEQSTDGHGEAIAYEYNIENQPTKITYPSGKAIERKYDAVGRLESVKDWLGHTTTFGYDPDSDESKIAFPSSTAYEDLYAYNDADEATNSEFVKGAESLGSVALKRGADGEITTSTITGLPGEAKKTYKYDASERLTKAGSTTYEYDAANNVTAIGSSKLSYTSADELEKVGTTGFTFNASGQRTQRTPPIEANTAYGYDQAGNLTSVSRAKSGEAPAIEDSYAYNGFGLRSSETIGAATSYLAWDEAEGLPLLLDNGAYSFIYGPDGLPIEQVNNTTGTVTYLHHDQSGSTRLLTGSTGKTEATFTYGAYGETTGSTGTATTPLGYDGEYTSSDTGLIYLRAREYDPATGQFLTRDPLAAISGAPYSYAGDNPLNRSDPAGLLPFGIKLPSWEEAGEAVAGWGDTITFGGTKWVREQLGDENVDTCSGAYQSGGVAGLVTGALIPGEDDAEAGELGVEGVDEGADVGSTPEGRPFTQHYGLETGPERNIPGSVVDQTINENPGVPGRNGTTVYYDPNNDVTVVTGRNGSIVSARRGEP